MQQPTVTAVKDQAMKKIFVFAMAMAMATISMNLCHDVNAAQLLLNEEGQLTGALGVEVFGAQYNVEFVDGTCAQVFDGCNGLTDFTFVGDWTDFIVVSEALRDQVLLDVTLGAFDTNPALTLGCQGGEFCIIQTPTEFGDNGFIGGTSYLNTPNPASGSGWGAFGSGPIFDSTGFDVVWARWTLSAAPVPVPGALWLFASAGIFFLRRKR